MYADLDTLLTALYVKIDDLLAGRRRIGRPPRFTDAELVTVAVAQAVLQVPSERRWLRIIDRFLAGMFPHLPQQPGYNKRLRAALPLLKTAMRELATDSDFWHDDVWIIDSTPVECGRWRARLEGTLDTEPALRGPLGVLIHDTRLRLRGLQPY